MLLSQFSGGPGPKENNLVRFGLPAILWGVLLVVAWSRQRRESLPREKLLVWGFGLGLARELFMFGHLMAMLVGLEVRGSASFVAEPLEQALTIAALVVVGGAFMRYILQEDTVWRNYMAIGLGTSGVLYLVTTWWWTQETATNPLSRFNQTWCGFVFHASTSVLSVIAILLLTRKRGWLRNTVSVALGLFFLSGFLKLVNFPTNRAYAHILCPLANSFHVWAIPLLGYVYIREQSIEKRRAEQAITAYQDHLEDLVDQRTTELTDANRQLEREVTERKQAEIEIARRNSELAAQNAIAATISQSLELDVILITALERALKVLNMEVGGIFLLESEGDSLTLRVHQAASEAFLAQARPLDLNECISGEAVMTMAPVVVDVAEYSGQRMSPFMGDVRTLVSTPLVSKGQALGALTLGSQRADAILPEGIDLLTAIGQQIGMAVENARLYHETERWAEELALLHQVSLCLNSTLDANTIYQQIAEQSAKLMACQMAHVFRWDEALDEAVGVFSYGTDGSGMQGMPVRPQESELLTALLADRHSIAVEDAQVDPRVFSPWRSQDTRSLLAIPMWGTERPLGFLLLIDQRRRRRWRSDELELVESFVNRAAIALENAYLHRQVEIAAALEERQRIAADMHDGLAQTLSYLGFKVDQATELIASDEMAAAQAEYQHIRDAIDRASREVRLSIASLQESPRPRRSLQEWVIDLMNGFAQEYRETDGPTMELNDTIQEPLYLPPKDIEQMMCVVQEALLNARRHACAQRVVVRLARQAGQLELAVEDDGCGFAPHRMPVENGDHFGLRIMRARATQIGGQVIVDSTPGHGTQVILKVPLRE
jgi:signal transduction histidine kinase